MLYQPCHNRTVYDNLFFNFIEFSPVITLTVPIFLHKMRISTIDISSVMLVAKIWKIQSLSYKRCKSMFVVRDACRAGDFYPVENHDLLFFLQLIWFPQIWFISWIVYYKWDISPLETTFASNLPLDMYHYRSDLSSQLYKCIHLSLQCILHHSDNCNSHTRIRHQMFQVCTLWKKTK